MGAQEQAGLQADTLAEAVGISIGSASMAWEDVTKAGVFQEQQARVVVDELVAWIEDRYVLVAAASENAPTPFALGEAPGPAEFPDPPAKPRKTGLATHTGTDPHGRAIGPAEDHTKAKRDYDGLTAKEAAEKATDQQEDQA